MTNSVGSSSSHMIKGGVYKDFDGVNDPEFKKDIKECHERALEYLNPVDVIVGSLGVHTKDLDIVYFKEKPNFSRYGDVDIYGSNTAVQLEKLGYWLLSNSRHYNGFNVFDRSWNIKSITYLMGYRDSDWFYYGPGEIMEDMETRITKWINKEWEKVCNKSAFLFEDPKDGNYKVKLNLCDGRMVCYNINLANIRQKKINLFLSK